MVRFLHDCVCALDIEKMLYLFRCDFWVNMCYHYLVCYLLGFWHSRFDICSKGTCGWESIFFQERVAIFWVLGFDKNITRCSDTHPILLKLYIGLGLRKSFGEASGMLFDVWVDTCQNNYLGGIVWCG